MTEAPTHTCPECRVPLREARVFGELRYGCSECKGLAVPLASLARIADPQVNTLVRDALAHASHPSDRTCPKCPRVMERADLTLSGLVVVVDACRHCDLVWFDAGELEQIPKRRRYDHEAVAQADRLVSEARRGLELRHAKRSEADALLPVASPLAIVIAFLGFPVEADHPRLARRPVVTWTACAALLVAFALEKAGLFTADDAGFVPADWTRAGGLTVLSAFFFHVDWGHLLGNVWFLYTFGDDVEAQLGRRRYLALLLAGVLFGAIGHAAGDADRTTPLVGASAGISAVLAFYGLQYPLRTLVAAYARIPVRIPALGYLVLWIILQLAGAMLQREGRTAVSAFAHLGGVLAGTIAWALWRKPARSEL
jgi:membrane associated rhomboid family serine protease/Zn-finger nucleic acid-binding protein